MQPIALGRYRIVRILGRGGMGVVYEGHDPQIDRPVAIKTIALGALNEQERAIFESRFRAEMRSIGRLQHHHIAALYDTGRDDGTAFIVMELVAGRDLKERLVSGERFDVAKAVDIALQLLTALEYAHARNVIHRDVKPANVMLQDDGVVKLCDFGVARLADSDATRTQGMIVGSLRYASPEQVLGRPIDARTDVFSAGVLLFELLTGQVPFKGQSDAEVLHRVVTEAAPSPRALDACIPIELDLAVRGALAKEPAERFASAAAFARALGASAIISPDTRPPMPAALRSPPVVAAASMRRRWAAAAAGGAVVVGLGSWYASRPTQEQAVQAALAPAPRNVGLAMASASDPSKEPSVLAGTGVASYSINAARASSASPPLPATSASALVTPTRPSVVTGAAVSRQAPIVRPPEGPWRGQLACGPIVPNPVGPGSESFSTELDIEVKGSHIGWTRETSVVHSKVGGTFDAQGRLSANGEGSRKDRPEHWSERASGIYQVKTRRIEGRLQMLRSSDQTVARECTWVAEPGTAYARSAASSVPGGTSVTTPLVAVPQGSWAGRLACGASQSPNVARPEADAFTAEIAVQVNGTRITLTRNQATLTETSAGTFDARGHFRAEGDGSYKDLHGRWGVQASGEFLPNPVRIEGRVLLVRPGDGGVARECTLRADRP